MQSVSTTRFNLLPLVAALAIAVSVGVGAGISIGFIAFDSEDTAPGLIQSVQREPDIHSVLVRDTGGPWVSPGGTTNVSLPADTEDGAPYAETPFDD